MAHEAEKLRLATLLTSAIGITRQMDSALEREADERALEARQQTGLTFTGTENDEIVHPTSAQRRSRLGVPVSVGTAELATWNYLFHDPVVAASNGLLGSTPHHAILANPIYTHWGFGIYTELPTGQTDPLFMRWYFIIWFATESVGEAVIAKPSETFSTPKYVGFATGTHFGYQFSWEGKILDSKKLTLTSASQAQAKGRGKIPNRAGHWLLINNGALQDYWVLERGFVAMPNAPKLT